MNLFRYQVFSANAVAAWLLLFALPQAVHAVSMIRVSDPSLCVDGMETDPDSGDEDMILVAADGGCMIQMQDVISI